jgi:hypothetical protein
MFLFCMLLVLVAEGALILPAKRHEAASTSGLRPVPATEAEAEVVS